MSDIENEFFYDPRTGRVAGDALAGDADGLVERVAQRLLEDAAYIENYSGFVGNPDYIARNQRKAAAALVQLHERAKHWEHEALCLGEFAATYNRDAELQNLMSLNNDLLERLAIVERERDEARREPCPDALPCERLTRMAGAHGEAVAQLRAAEAKVLALTTALRPFAVMAESYEPPEGDDDLHIWDTHSLTIGDLRRALAALEQAKPTGSCSLLAHFVLKRDTSCAT